MAPTPYGILDSGATGHFSKSSYKYKEKPTTESITVTVGNHGTVNSVATDEFQWHNIKRAAKTVDKFPDNQFAETLVSVPQLARNGYTTVLTPTNAVVYDEHKQPVLRAPFDPLRQAWIVPLKTPNTDIAYNSKHTQPKLHHPPNSAFHVKTTPSQATELYRAIQSPITSIACNKPSIRREACFSAYVNYLPHAETPLQPRALSAYTIKAIPALIRWHHASAGYPVKITWIDAIRQGNYMGWPGLSARLVQKHLLPSEHTANGHLHLTKQGVRSTKPTIPRSKAHDILLKLIETEKLKDDPTITDLKNLIASDLPGRYPITSARGNKYLLVMYDYDTNYIMAEPIQSRHTEDLIKGFSTCYQVLTDNGFTAKTLRCDNEISREMKNTLTHNNVTWELVPPRNHRSNPAERAIQTYKNHFIAMLSGTDPTFPDNAWDQLIPLANITLNLLRQSKIQPKLSAYAQMHGPYDYNRHPLAPAGCKLSQHRNPRHQAKLGQSCHSKLLYRPSPNPLSLPPVLQPYNQKSQYRGYRHFLPANCPPHGHRGRAIAYTDPGYQSYSFQPNRPSPLPNQGDCN